MIDPRDLTIYPTIQIGSKVWFASNLNYGRSIAWNRAPSLKDSTEKYCPFQNQHRCQSSDLGGYVLGMSQLQVIALSCERGGRPRGKPALGKRHECPAFGEVVYGRL